jgi:DNA repair exonuclease SbcCD ATPase subunit
MKLLSIKAINFMGLTGEHDLALDDLGLVHVAGLNLDDPGNSSNGAGKSTILEALTWGLFGEGLPRPQGNSEQGVRADEVLNDQLNKQCRVVVRLSDGEKIYSIERYRKFKVEGARRQQTGVTFYDGLERAEALDEKETNRLICEALGMTHDIWCRGVVFGQEAGFNFCDATAKSRQEILTTVMGLEEIDTWQERCRDEKRALVSQMAEMDGRLSALRRQDEQLRAENPAERVAEWEAQRVQRRRDLELEQQSIEDHGKALKAQLGAQPELPELSEASQFGVSAEIAEPYRKAEADVRDAKDMQGRIQADLRIAQQRLEQVVTFGQQSACPTCGQAIAKEHQDRCVAAAQRTVGEVNGVLQNAVRVHQEAQARFETARRAYQDASVAAEQAMAEYQGRAIERERLASQRGRLGQDIAVARTRWLEAGQRLKLIDGEVNPHLAYQAEMEGKIERVAAELAEAEAEQSQIGTALDVCQWWDRELPRFRVWMFDSIVDILAAEANRWLSVMSGGVVWIQITTTKMVNKKLKDELDVQIYRWNPDGTITQRAYRVWSGGEKRRVALAVDLGLSRLMAQRASKPYKFLALDEIDRHLDGRGKEGLRQVLDELRREKETVITITHDPLFRASFDSEIVVTKERSRVRMEVSDGRQEPEAGG